MQEHGQDPGVVGPEDAGFGEVGVAEDAAPQQHGHVVGAPRLVAAVQDPGRRLREGDPAPRHVRAEREGPDAVAVLHPHLRRSAWRSRQELGFQPL